ncbi:MAG TPA: hypothetical protein VH637_03970 [Streptosporangiaceae bacterium]|jgi:hypothetical protein
MRTTSRPGRLIPALAAAGLTAAAVLASLPATAARAAVVPNRALFGVAAASARNAWAVGYRYNGTADQTLIEHWNGKTWKQVHSPSPGGSVRNSELLGVTTVSARGAWAVGGYAGVTYQHTLIEHWNGKTWRQLHSPGRCGTTGSVNVLNSVAATSATSAWAVGSGTSCQTGQPATLILHWNGTSWHRAASVNPGGPGGRAELLGVTATSRRNAWAVGDYAAGAGQQPRTLIEHWNGRSWRQVPSPGLSSATFESLLTSVTATSAGRAWAVGLRIKASPHIDTALVLHWNGKSWKQVAARHPGGTSGDELLGVTAVPRSKTLWAVGDYTDPVLGRDHTLVERWNGTRWRRVPSPSPAFPAHEQTLVAADATGSRNVWAVGSYAEAPALHMLFEHWNGKSWRIR